MNTGGKFPGERTVPLCPNCRECNACYLHQAVDPQTGAVVEAVGDAVFECAHCDQLFTFNPVGRRLPEDYFERRRAAQSG